MVGLGLFVVAELVGIAALVVTTNPIVLAVACVAFFGLLFVNVHLSKRAPKRVWR